MDLTSDEDSDVSYSKTKNKTTRIKQQALKKKNVTTKIMDTVNLCSSDDEDKSSRKKFKI
jgi:hypothetical protein